MHKQSLLLTGGTGFLGSNIKPLLENYYSVKTLGQSEKNDYCTDLRTADNIKFSDKFNVIVHTAGKTRNDTGENTTENNDYYKINYNGTKNLCKALENNLPESFIYISTVAVYGCEEGTNISETHPLNGKTPYAKSKIMAEQFLTDWSKKYNIDLIILRPPLIVGANSSGSLRSMINGIRTGRYLSIGGGKAKKSIILAEDIAEVIQLLHNKNKTGIYNICNTKDISFRELELIISSQLGCPAPLNIPLWAGKLLAFAGNILGNKAPLNYAKYKKIVSNLTFSNKKICNELNWTPKEISNDYKLI